MITPAMSVHVTPDPSMPRWCHGHSRANRRKRGVCAVIPVETAHIRALPGTPRDGADCPDPARRLAGRPFASPNAWALLLLASGEEVTDIDPSVRSRLCRAILQSGNEELVPWLGNRGDIHSRSAHAGEIRYPLEDRRLLRSGVSAAADYGLGLVSGAEADGYVSGLELKRLIKAHALAPAGLEGNVRLRAVPVAAWRFGAGAAVAPVAAVAIDLAEDPHPRSASVGRGPCGDLRVAEQ